MHRHGKYVFLVIFFLLLNAYFCVHFWTDESNRRDPSVIVWQRRSFHRSSRGQPEGSSAPGRWSGSAPDWSPRWLLSGTPDCPGPQPHPPLPARRPWKNKQGLMKQDSSAFWKFDNQWKLKTFNLNIKNVLTIVEKKNL